MSTICFYAQFTTSKLGTDSLTVTWDIERITRSDGSRSALVTGGANGVTIGRRGLYGYVLTGADLTLYDYLATAITATATVDQQEVPAIWTLWSLSWYDIATSIMTVVGSIGKLFTDMFSDYARRTGDYSTLTAGSQMDLIDSLKNKVGATGYDRTTDSLEALGEGGSNPWDTATSTMTTPGSVGKLVVDNVDTTISSRSTLTASQVWLNSTRTLSSFGTLIYDIWNYASRSLSEYLTSGTIPAPVGADITITGFTTNVITILNVSSTTDAWFTVKQSRGQLDSESILQLSRLGGLLYINGLTAIGAGLTSADASYTIVGANAVVTLSAALAAKLVDKTELLGELKTKTAGGVVSVATTFSVDIVNAVGRTI